MPAAPAAQIDFKTDAKPPDGSIEPTRLVIYDSRATTYILESLTVVLQLLLKITTFS